MKKSSILSFIIIIICIFIAGCKKTTTIENTFKLNDSGIMMYIGDEYDLIDSSFNDSTTFESLNTDVVTVDKNGKVKALSAGSTYIIARSNNVSGTCLVIVLGDAPINITDLSIDSKPQEIETGSRGTFYYTKTPSDADNYNSIKWSSSDENILSIDDAGNYNAVAPGTATITLTATGTDYVDSFTVNIKARESVLSLNCYDAVGIKGMNDLTLSADLFTDYKDVSDGVWSTSDDSVVSVENGELSFNNVGKAVITYSVNVNGEDITKECRISVVDLENYTVIRTPDELQAIENTSGNYILGNDIDMTNACLKGGSLYHGGSGFSPLFSDAQNAFKGVFDGMGYSIINLEMYSTNAFTALFSYVSTVSGKEAVIRNLSLTGGHVTGGNYTAALIGRCNSTEPNPSTVIENCYVDITVSSFGLASGFIGYNGGTIKNCISYSTVSSSIASQIALRQVDDASIGIGNIYILDSETEAVLPDYINNAYINIVKVSEENKLKASTYSTLDSSKWIIKDGIIPKLKTLNYTEGD